MLKTCLTQVCDIVRLSGKVEADTFEAESMAVRGHKIDTPPGHQTGYSLAVLWPRLAVFSSFLISIALDCVLFETLFLHMKQPNLFRSSFGISFYVVSFTSAEFIDPLHTELLQSHDFWSE